MLSDATFPALRTFWERVEMDETKQVLNINSHSSLQDCQKNSSWQVMVCIHTIGWTDGTRAFEMPVVLFCVTNDLRALLRFNTYLILFRKVCFLHRPAYLDSRGSLRVVLRRFASLRFAPRRFYLLRRFASSLCFLASCCVDYPRAFFFGFHVLFALWLVL